MEFGKIFLPFLIDLTELLRNKGEDGRVLQGVVRQLRVAHMRYLSVPALLQLVQYDVIYFLRFDEQFLSDIRYLYYVAEPEYDGGEWGRQFVPALKKNQELLGSQIVVLEKPVAATVEHWLAEYDVASGKQALERGALDRIKFVNEHPSAKQLSKEDQTVLLKLCELYDWFADPYVTEQELEEFVDLAPATTRPGLLPSEMPPGIEEAPVEESVLPFERDQATDKQVALPMPEFADNPTQRGDAMEMAQPERVSADRPGDEGVMSPDVSVPNVQGVLVQVPLGASERTGLEVVQEVDSSPTPPVGVIRQKQGTPAARGSEPVNKRTPAANTVNTASLEALKMQAQAKQEQMQAEIEEKLAKLKRKS